MLPPCVQMRARRSAGKRSSELHSPYFSSARVASPLGSIGESRLMAEQIGLALEAKTSPEDLRRQHEAWQIMAEKLVTPTGIEPVFQP